MRRRNAITVPDVPTGAILNPCKGFFSVIVPVERTNLDTNPSFESGTTGYTAVGGSITRTTGASYHGAYSLSVALRNGITGAQDGVYYGTVSLTSGTIYAASCKFKAFAPGLRYQISIATTGGVDLSLYSFIATARWQWVWVYWTETSSTTRRIYVRKNDTREDPNAGFLIDGVQVEAIAAGETVSTFIDGDQQGLLNNQFPYPYRWNGTPHASTSTRLATTRAGGMVVNLDRFRYRVLAYTGLGLTLVANIASIPAAADGGTYQATIARPRSFAINGFFDGRDLTMLDQMRSDLYSALGPDGAVPRQPLRLVYQAHDGRDARSQIGTITAAYEHGLEGTTANLHRDTAPITFTAYIPTVQTGDGGVLLPLLTSFTNANNIVQRSATGQWSAMGTGGAGATIGVQAFAQILSGSIYAGGDFTGMGGVANTGRIARWDGSAWNEVGGGLSDRVYAIAVDTDGTSIYVGGDFLNAGGVANADRIAKWDGSNWTALSTGANNTVGAIVVGPDGTVYAGGTFTSIGGVAIDRIAKWDGATWSVLDVAGADAAVATLAFGLDGNLYAGGSFTTIGGVTAAGIAYWDGVAWNAMGNTFTGSVAVNAIAIGPNGAVYAGGTFNETAAVWNGTAWTQLGDLAGGNVYALRFGADGLLYASGTFTSADGVTFGDSLATWNGSAWTMIDVLLPGTATVYGIFTTADGRVFAGYSTTGSATAPVVTTATNDGTARTYPTFQTIAIALGGASLYRITNVTNGKTLFFNYILAANEVLTIRTTPTGVRVTSSFRGDVTSAILPGSSPDFALERGANLISYAATKVSARMIWPLAYQALSDLTD